MTCQTIGSKRGGQNHHLAEACGRPYFKLAGDKLVRLSNEAVKVDGKGSLLDRAFDWSLLYRVSSNLIPAKKVEKKKVKAIFAEEYTTELKESWALSKHLISAISSKSSELNSDFAVLIVPSPAEAGDPRHKKQISPEQLQKPSNILKVFLKESEIAYVDLLPLIRERVRKGEELFFCAGSALEPRRS